mmetsp:Transcript_9955/g.24346  ORF Transcript_9955/g.24346 Transcript_9955/m.24346 type:complete len:264 (-) Transcript_9955:246-1037(-)
MREPASAAACDVIEIVSSLGVLPGIRTTVTLLPLALGIIIVIDYIPWERRRHPFGNGVQRASKVLTRVQSPPMTLERRLLHGVHDNAIRIPERVRHTGMTSDRHLDVLEGVRHARMASESHPPAALLALDGLVVGPIVVLVREAAAVRAHVLAYDGRSALRIQVAVILRSFVPRDNLLVVVVDGGVLREQDREKLIPNVDVETRFFVDLIVVIAAFRTTHSGWRNRRLRRTFRPLPSPPPPAEELALPTPSRSEGREPSSSGR